MPFEQTTVALTDLRSPVAYGVDDGLRAGLLPCLHADPGIFFSEDPGQLEIAKSLCRRCPARRACLAGALARREDAGVWGGQIFERGRVIPMKRRRGRPRQTPTK